MVKISEQLKERFNKYPLYSQEEKSCDAIVIAEFDLPVSTGEPFFWMVTEAEKQEDDYLFFGYVCLGNWNYAEFGYFRLSELELLSYPVLVTDFHGKEVTVRKAIEISKCF